MKNRRALVKKIMAWGAVLSLAFAFTSCGATEDGNGGVGASQEAEASAENAGAEEEKAPGSGAQASDEVVFDGIKASLNTKMSEYIDAGWQFPENSYKAAGADELVKANSAQPVEMSKDGLAASITALNDTDSDIAVKDCSVQHITVKLDKNPGDYDFVFPQGLDINDITYDKLTSAYGTPSNESEGSDAVTVSYNIGGGKSYMSFRFSLDRSELLWAEVHLIDS